MSLVTNISYEEALKQLPKGMQNGIEWFNARKGLEIDWPHPSPIVNFPNLVTPAKAIYKPAIHMNPKDVAFSIRQNLGSTYGDIEPILRSDGSWVYQYHQEGVSPDAYANRSLLRNIVTHSPIAVLIQTKKKPKPKYLVLGIAIVATYENDFFYFEGFNNHGFANLDTQKTLQLAKAKKDELEKGKSETSSTDIFVPPDLANADNSLSFKNDLLAQYNSECAITGTNVPATLEVAFLAPLLSGDKQLMSNALLVRADIRNLLVDKLLTLNPKTRRVVIGRVLRGTVYSVLNGVLIAESKNGECRPTEFSLEQHFKSFSNSEKQDKTVAFGSELKSISREDVMELKRTDYIRIPLTAIVKGEERVPSRSGLNWGQRPGRNPNQAYLPVSADVQRNGFLPQPGISFTIECDDGAIFECVRAQQNGKAIETPTNNAIIGEYFRKRLGVESGESVALWHLIDYGRTSVEIFQLSGLRYYLDFSRPK